MACRSENICTRLLSLFVICSLLCSTLRSSAQYGNELKQPGTLNEDTQKLQRTATTYTVETENDSVTNIEIYFTDGKGSFYRTEPEVEILNHSTGKQVMQFKRTVTTQGNPEPKKIAAGTYDLKVFWKTTPLASGIAILDKKKNKLITKVSGGMLRFAYEENPNKPVSEFTATVTKKFDNSSPVTTHKCDEELSYWPGNYHIEINTLPVTRLNIDLDFGSETEVRLPEPGYVVFAQSSFIKNVTLYEPWRSKDGHITCERFISLDLPGDINRQKFQLKPGAYEAHYKSSLDSSNTKETVIKFVIKPNQITGIELL